MRLQRQDLHEWRVERDLLWRLVVLVRQHPDAVPRPDLDAVLARADRRRLALVPSPRQGP